MNPSMSDSDHDLLIAVNTKLERVLIDMKDLKDNTVARVDNLENEKVDKTTAAITAANLKEYTDTAAKLIKEEKIAQDDKISRLEKIVYGCVALILVGFIGALIAMVYRKT